MKTRALLAAVLALLLLAGCAKEEKKLVQFPIAGTFTTNVRENPKKYLRCVIELSVYNTITTEDLTAKLGEMKSAVIRVLRQKNEEQLAAVDIQDTLSAEITEALNVVLDDDYVERVLFTEFVVS